MEKPVYLKREIDGSFAIRRAVLRDDGVHFIDRDGRERTYAEYPSIEKMNQTLRELHYTPFVVDDGVRP